MIVYKRLSDPSTRGMPCNARAALNTVWEPSISRNSDSTCVRVRPMLGIKLDPLETVVVLGAVVGGTTSRASTGLSDRPARANIPAAHAATTILSTNAIRRGEGRRSRRCRAVPWGTVAPAARVFIKSALRCSFTRRSSERLQLAISSFLVGAANGRPPCKWAIQHIDERPVHRL